MPIAAPCKGCVERYPGCRGHCNKYKQFRTEYDKEKEYKKRNITPLIRFGSFLGDREILGYTAKRQKKSGR